MGFMYRTWRGRSSRIARWATIACVLVAGALAAPGAPSKAASSGPSFSTDPGLTPGFRWGVHDYAIRCDSDRVRISIHTPGGWLGRIGSGDFQRADFVARRPLTPGKALMVTFRRANQPRRHNFHARCLPPDFPAYDFTRTGPGGPGYFIVQMNNDYAAIFDRHGVPVWWYKASDPTINAELLPDGTVAWDSPTLGSPLNGYEIRSLNGRLVRVVKAAGGLKFDLHDLQLLPNGNYLLGAEAPVAHVDAGPYGGPSDATVLGYQIQEVTPKGKLVWKWNSLGHIGLPQTPTRWWNVVLGQSEPYDIQHWNSLELEPDGKHLLLSFRNLDAVYEINRHTGAVVWKLGGTTIPKSLQVLDDPYGSYPLGGQHDARRLPDGTISIHDNATDLSMPTRAVRYRIDPQARTATLVESVSDPDYPASPCCGSARKLPFGGWLIGWGRSHFVGAYNSDGQRIFKLDFPNGFFYRAFPVSPHAITAQQLRQGMNAISR
jgi:Arylsulfotransferase (ASST)